MDDDNSLSCCCGRVFTQNNALSYHKRSCGKSKKRLADALLAAKEVFEQKKRRRIEVQSSSMNANTQEAASRLEQPSVTAVSTSSHHIELCVI
jgi:hypothetical protein